jgi:glucose/arabinose dehydrogenase
MKVAVAGLALSATAGAQGSTAALHFFGTASNQQDRVRIRLDDDASGPDASTHADIGGGSFSLQFWMRGLLAENNSTWSGAQGSYPDERWLSGNCVLDRSVLSGTGRTFGVSIAGGRVRFGTGSGDGPVFDVPNTLEGDIFVLDGEWHHVSVSRDESTGAKTIFVDGMLDISSPMNTSRADLSYPDDGVPGSGSAFGPFLVVGAAKDDVGPTRPSFRGYVDELHLWSRSRRGAEVVTDMVRVVPPGSVDLVSSYRFEEGVGTVVHDTSGAGGNDGSLIAGTAGNGEWTLQSQGSTEVAPVTEPMLPAGFTRQQVVGGLNEPTSMAIAPDGRIFVTQRTGLLRVVSNGVMLPTPALTVPVDSTSGERGLLSIALDPDFLINGWIYLYSMTPQPRGRIARYTMVGDVADPASQTILWENSGAPGSMHQGGGMAFGPDGKFYFAVGDQGTGGNSQDLSNELGKIMRIAKDGSIPSDNPFLGVAGARPTLFAYGARNPFRMVVHPTSGAMWYSDVGGNAATAFEELNRISPGANYGWPGQEGTACFVSSCAGITFPTWSYQHSDPAYSIVTGGGCIVAGAFYVGTQFPAEYQGNLFVGDYGNRWMRRLIFDASGNNVVAAPVFDPQPAAGPLVDIDVGPDGALYTLTYGTGSGVGAESSRIARISWTGSNLPPLAVATATNVAGLDPLTVSFQGSASSDPDQTPAALTFAWDFGDGTGSTQADPLHTYLVQGAYEARLTASDGANSTTSAPILVRVGTPPVVQLDVPAATGLYRAGDVIQFSGAATDVEDGALTPSALTWQVLLVHLAHTHPHFGPTSGIASGSFQIPISGHEPADTHFQIRLIARDSSGLESERTIDLHPSIAPVVFTTKPQGIPLVVDGAPQPTPYPFDGLAGYQHALEAPATRQVGGTLYAFRRWSNGVTTPASTWTTPDPGGRAIAEYLPTTKSKSIVGSAVRNAQYDAAHGQTASEPGSPLRIAFGREAGVDVQAGFEFRLPVPRGARIVSARFEALPALAASDALELRIRAYDVGHAPAFVPGSSTPLTAHAPLLGASVSWTPGDWTPGQTAPSPEIAQLVEAIVARPDWNAGGVLGIVIEPAAPMTSGLRRVLNFASGEEPQLVLYWQEMPTVGGH